MRSVIAESYGGPDVLHVVNTAPLAPVPGEVRVAVEASTIGPTDDAIREGRFTFLMGNSAPPFVLGWDFSGTSLDDLDDLPRGSRVAGLVPWFENPGKRGTWAEQISVKPGWITAIPEAVSSLDAATVPLNGLTALQGLRQLDLSAEHTVVVTGASGGVGSYAVQLAAQTGARVIALASTGDGDYIRALGATQVIEVTRTDDLAAVLGDAAPGGVDRAFDTASVTPAILPAIKPGGRVVTVSSAAVPADPGNVDVSAVGVRPDQADLALLISQLATGQLTPTRIVQAVDLADAQAAMTLARSGIRGKVLLTTTHTP